MKKPIAKRPLMLFVEVCWDLEDFSLKERIPIDLRSLQSTPEQSISTTEFWPAYKEPLYYKPRTCYSVLTNGDHQVILSYRRHDHRGHNRPGIVWGVATVVISKAIDNVTVKWKSDPKGFGEDGTAKSKFHVEEPSQSREAMKSVRKSQQRFKEKILRFGSACEITREKLPAVLDAAHILDVKDGGPDVPENGILLRADLHRLFDQGYFGILDDGTIKPHLKLPTMYRKLLTDCCISAKTMHRIRPYLVRRRERTPI